MTEWPEDVVERLTKAANRFRTVGAPQGDLWSGARNDLVKEALAFVDALATHERVKGLQAWSDDVARKNFSDVVAETAALRERVKGLVSALEKIAAGSPKPGARHEIDDCPDSMEIARSALASWGVMEAPDRIWLMKVTLERIGKVIASKPSESIDAYAEYVRADRQWPADWFMEQRLESLLNPDEMHPVGCSSWDAEAHAFIELIALHLRGEAT